MKILSLFWHNVNPDSSEPNYSDGSNPEVSVFRDQIKYIVEYYSPISIHEFRDIMHNKKEHSFMKPPVLLGFDDGFRNVIDHALPILTEFNVPALFFVTGESIKNNNFIHWDVEMKHLIRRTSKSTFVYRKNRINLSNKQGVYLLRRLFARNFRACTREESRQELLNDLAYQLHVVRPMNASNLDDDFQLIRKDDLSELDSSSLLTVASHGMTHRYLDSLTHEEQVYELEQSNYLLNKYCKNYYPTLAYPAGSFNKDTLNIAMNIYESAFAVFLNSSYRNIFAYPRTGISNSTVQELEYILNPFRLNLILPIKRLLHNIGLRRIN